MASTNVQVPRALLRDLIEAVQLADRDSRGKDRVLHDKTISLVQGSSTAWGDFLRERVLGGGDGG